MIAAKLLTDCFQIDYCSALSDFLWQPRTLQKVVEAKAVTERVAMIRGRLSGALVAVMVRSVLA
jgi:hypothetical protein